MSVGMMTSCSSSDTEETNVNRGTVPATVTLKFMTSNGLTRTSGAIPTSTTFGEGENAVSTCVVGVFDAAPAEGNSNDANTVTLVKKTDAIAKDKDGDNDQGKLEISTNTSAKYVYMAANINHDDVTTALSTRLANFKTITCNLNETKNTDGNGQETTKLPMSGGGAITYDAQNTTSGTGSIILSRLVARVALSSLKTDFSSNPIGSFQPTEIFMYNVNDQCTLAGTASQNSSIAEPTGNDAETTSGKFELTQRGVTAKGNITNSTSNTTNAYLSSGYLGASIAADVEGAVSTWIPASNENGIKNPHYFYVFPHDATNPTKLVIKGIWTPATGDASVVYYPIIIGNKVTINNTETSENNVLANHAYKISVTIMGKGTSNPSIDIVPATASITITVTDWTPATQDVIIN